MNPYIRKISATNLFVVPLLGIRRESLIRLGFVDAFIKDELKELEYDNVVYLLFRPLKWTEFNIFVEEQRKLGAIVDEYDYSDGWAVVVFKYDKKWEKDVNTIMIGKFSKTSKEYKSFLPYYADTEKQELTNQQLILEKRQEVKDYWKQELDLSFEEGDEVWHFYSEREILNEESIKRLTNMK